MEKNKTVSGLKKQLAAAIAMVLVAAISLGTSTYAWFVNNTKVTAESVNVTAKAANTLLISEQGQNTWKTLLPLTDTLNELVPVSTIGSDGTDLTFVKDNAWTTDATDKMSYASGFEAATANTDYYTTTFDIKGSVAGSKLYLDKETTFTMATKDGTATLYDNSVLKTLRLGIVIDGKTYIYQIDGTNLTSNYDTSISSTDAVDGIKKAINSTGASADINMDNGNATSGVTVLPLATTPANNTKFVEETNDADLLYTFVNSGDVVTVKAYIWMEGCDYDCNSAVVASITAQKVIAKLGFAVANA